jgi:hypothetical protein
MDTGKDNEQVGPLLIEGPNARRVSAPVIELKASDAATDHDEIDTETTEADATTAFIPPTPQSAWHWPLAAGVIVAAAVGAMAGAGTTATLLHDKTPPATFADATTIHTLQTSVAQLGSELATLKSGIANAQRTSSTQFGKLTERLDRSEKTQEKALAEPAAKLAKIQESIDRLEKRPQQPTIAAAPVTVPAHEVTGSIAPKESKEPKEEPKPIVAPGWRLVDYYDGRAVVENRHGTVFRIGTGSNLPGLGKVESVKRESGRITVVTAGGIITAALEQPRRMPPQFYRW